MISNKTDQIVVNPQIIHQEFIGFGVSGAWWAQVIGGWDTKKRDRVIELLFDRENGIGVSIYRYNIGGGARNVPDPWRCTETFEIAPQEYDWDADANAIVVLKAAYKMGVEHLVAFVNSPPGRMTQSGLATGMPDGTSNLRRDMYEDFARYIVDVVCHLSNSKGLPIRWVSPINEPEWDWGNSPTQEGCHYEIEEVIEVLLKLKGAIDTSGIDVRISAPDSAKWGCALLSAEKIFAIPQLAENLDHFCVHSYFSSPSEKQDVAGFLKANHPEIQLWMSEWTEMKSGRDTGMASALTMANVIHEDLTIASVSSWQYWIAVSPYDYHDGLVYTDGDKQNIIETKRLWVLGNYSRFIRPGYARIDASTNSPDLKITAFQAPDQSVTIIVIVNNGAQSIHADLIMKSDSSIYNVAVYQTSDTLDLELVFQGSPQNVDLAPFSVTTIRLSK